MDNNCKLTIGIPTYNRAGKVIKLLDFLKKEFCQFSNSQFIEVIVCDNCSTDNTKDILQEYKSYNNDNKFSFSYYRNESNIGLVNNVLKIFSLAKGDYVWCMGDDDLYYDGIVKKVFEVVQAEDYTFLFINHCLYAKYKGDKTYIPSMLDGIDSNREDCDVLLEITRLHGTCLMFISATVFKRNIIIELQKESWDINLAYPLLMSFYSASIGKVKLINDILIDDIIGTTSWKNEKNDVFQTYVPYVLRQVLQMNYNKQIAFDLYTYYICNISGMSGNIITYAIECFRYPKYAIPTILKNYKILAKSMVLFFKIKGKKLLGR